jgi:hypothetical protein
MDMSCQWFFNVGEIYIALRVKNSKLCTLYCNFDLLGSFANF